MQSWLDFFSATLHAFLAYLWTPLSLVKTNNRLSISPRNSLYVRSIATGLSPFAFTKIELFNSLCCIRIYGTVWKLQYGKSGVISHNSEVLQDGAGMYPGCDVTLFKCKLHSSVEKDYFVQICIAYGFSIGYIMEISHFENTYNFDVFKHPKLIIKIVPLLSE